MSSDSAIAGSGAFGNDPLQESLLQKMGEASKRLEDLADDMGKAKDTDTARFQSLKEDQAEQAKLLTEMKNTHDAAVREAEVKAALEMAAEWKAQMANTREPSMAGAVGRGSLYQAPAQGAFLKALIDARDTDFDVQQRGKAAIAALSTYEGAWGKAALGSTDATGGWVIPNAIVDDLIKPAQVDNIYRRLMTVVSGVTAPSVDIPLRLAIRTRAAVATFGATKENVDLVYNGYTATMYTIARIHDIGNQFLRQSGGAAETDVMQELAAAFAQGESYYTREGSGTNQPFGYTSALTNGPATFRSTGPSLSDSTVAGSIAACIAICGGALAGRGVRPDAAVVSATTYWQMLRQGSDSAGFWFATNQNSPASITPGDLISPFGIPVIPDADADVEATAAVIDNLVVANWKAFKLYFGQNYRVDSSNTAGTRWDLNVTGFRGEEEMGFDARPAVYAGYAQMITDVIP